MTYYQHYSFDLWLTLIRSNPDFKTERAKIFHRDYNSLNKSIDDVAKAFRQVDLMCNAINERTGKNIDADEMYLMVISIINDNQLSFDEIDISGLCNDMDTLLFSYLPLPYDDVTIATLGDLKNKSGSTFSLLSNTGFIKGETLRKVLVELNIAQYFDFQLYSDEAGLSKPNPAFFELMMQNVQRVNHPKEISLNNIIHVGDNPKTDVGGANKAGIKSLLINSNNQRITSLLG